jgi:hypothetical protein
MQILTQRNATIFFGISFAWTTVVTVPGSLPAGWDGPIAHGISALLVNDCRVNATASQATHEFTTSTLSPDGSLRAGLLAIPPGRCFKCYKKPVFIFAPIREATTSGTA